MRYITSDTRNQRPRTGDAAALTRLLDLLTEKGVIAPRRTPIDVTPAQRLLDEYALYLRQERVLASPTRVNYLRFVRSFLADRFGRGRLRLSVLCAADVIRFVQHEAAHLSPKVATLVTTALRSFLQYARYRGYIAVPIGRWPRSPDQLSRITCGEFWQAATVRGLWAAGITQYCCCLRGSVCGLAKSPALRWKILIGKLAA